jgi:hypothetical protein
VVIGAGLTDPGFGPFDNRGAWTDIFAALAQTAVVSLTFSWLLEKASGGRQPPEAMRLTSRLAPAAALVLCALELTVANHWLIPTAPARIWREPSTVAMAIGQTDPSPRIYRTPTWWPAEFSRKSSASRMEEIVRWERDSLSGRYALLSDLGVVNAQEGIKAADYEYLVDRLTMITSDNVPIPATRALEELLSAEFLLLPHDLEVALATQSTAPSLSPDTMLWRMRSTPSRDWIPKKFLVRPTISTEFARYRATYSLIVTSGNQRFQDWAEVEGSLHPHNKPELVTPEFPPRSSVVHSSPGSVVVSASLPEWSLVVLNDRYASGWAASVRTSTSNGETEREVPIFRTNCFFRGVYLPQGEHTIEFRYQPQAFYRGAWISAVSWGTLVVGVGVWLLRRRR